jgi:hypothetical protein
MVGTLPSTFLGLRKAMPYFEKKNRKNAMHRPTMERYTALGLCMVRLTSCSLSYYTLLFASSRGNAEFVEFFLKQLNHLKILLFSNLKTLMVIKSWLINIDEFGQVVGTRRDTCILLILSLMTYWIRFGLCPWRLFFTVHGNDSFRLISVNLIFPPHW